MMRATKACKASLYELGYKKGRERERCVNRDKKDMKAKFIYFFYKTPSERTRSSKNPHHRDSFSHDSAYCSWDIIFLWLKWMKEQGKIFVHHHLALTSFIESNKNALWIPILFCLFVSIDYYNMELISLL